MDSPMLAHSRDGIATRDAGPFKSLESTDVVVLEYADSDDAQTDNTEPSEHSSPLSALMLNEGAKDHILSPEHNAQVISLSEPQDSNIEVVPAQQVDDIETAAPRQAEDVQFAPTIQTDNAMVTTLEPNNNVRNDPVDNAVLNQTGLRRSKHAENIKVMALDTVNNAEDTVDRNMMLFLGSLRERGIQFHQTHGNSCPEAMMHDRAATIPALVISPRSEWGVTQALRLLSQFDLGHLSISVKSGGHGYHNGATCSDIMLNTGDMSKRHIEGTTLFLQPGCILGQTIDILAKNRKAVPHGDCFGVGAGGHFLTAGWDLILGRSHGLGCQSVVGGRIVLWDGTVLDVNEESHPDLLYAMRGGAAAGVGVVTEIRLRLLDEPERATWRFTRLNKDQLRTCVEERAFSKAPNLPRDISMSFRFHFEPDQLEPVCSFNIVSLLTVDETMHCLVQHLGEKVTTLVDDRASWNNKTLVDLRLLPASEFLANHPDMLSEITHAELHENPEVYWKKTSSRREMARSYFTSISHWVVPACESMLIDLYKKFEFAQADPHRERMYALVIQGGGRMTELQHRCSMPLGEALARFELHWDDPGTEELWCRDFTNGISNIFKSKEDPSTNRPYRGDIWLQEQAEDPKLTTIHNKYTVLSATRGEGNAASASQDVFASS